MIGFVFGTLCLVGLVKVLRHGGACGPAFGYGGFGSHGGGCGHGYGRRFGGFGGHGHGGYGGHGYGGFEPGGPDARWRWHGHRGGPGFGRGFGAWGEWGGGGGGRAFFLRGVFERLDTTPGQEKVITQALDDLRTAGKGIKDEMRGARSELASALRGESFDEVALGGATARIETAVDSFRKAGIDAFAKIHGALDERQRATLADWLERGPRGFGPFR